MKFRVMACELLQLDGRIVLDNGDVLYTKDGAIEFVRDGGSLTDIMVEDTPDTKRYEHISGKRLRHAYLNGEISELSPSVFEWNIPSGYENFDIGCFCEAELCRRRINTEAYSTRLATELGLIEMHGMTPLFRVIRAMVVDFTDRSVVWGVGRGSSCASLVLFLLGLHRVDPVLYDIDMIEFYKELQHA